MLAPAAETTVWPTEPADKVNEMNDGSSQMISDQPKTKRPVAKAREETPTQNGGTKIFNWHVSVFMAFAGTVYASA